jgi:hypothetical protein
MDSLEPSVNNFEDTISDAPYLYGDTQQINCGPISHNDLENLENPENKDFEITAIWCYVGHLGRTPIFAVLFLLLLKVVSDVGRGRFLSSLPHGEEADCLTVLWLRYYASSAHEDQNSSRFVWGYALLVLGNLILIGMALS